RLGARRVADEERTLGRERRPRPAADRRRLVAYARAAQLPLQSIEQRAHVRSDAGPPRVDAGVHVSPSVDEAGKRPRVALEAARHRAKVELVARTLVTVPPTIARDRQVGHHGATDGTAVGRDVRADEAAPNEAPRPVGADDERRVVRIAIGAHDDRVAIAREASHRLLLAHL